MPGFAHGAHLQHAIVLGVVVGNCSPAEVKGNLAPQTDGDVGDVSHRLRGYRCFDRADGLGTALDAIEEVARVTGAVRELGLEGGFVNINEVFGLQFQVAAGPLCPAVGPSKAVPCSSMRR